jgi:hypothetical protein
VVVGVPGQVLQPKTDQQVPLDAVDPAIWI